MDTENPKPLDPDFFDIVGTETNQASRADELPDDVRAIVEKIKRPLGGGRPLRTFPSNALGDARSSIGTK